MVAQKHDRQSRLITGLAQQSPDIVHVGLDLIVTQRGKAWIGGQGVEAEENAGNEFLMLADPLRVDEAVGIERRYGA